MASELRTIRRVEFSDTDMAGVLHFANYLRYMEEAEHAFVRSLGLSVFPQDSGDHPVVFPRLSTRFEYFRPLRFEDEVEVHLWVARKGTSSLTYQCRFSRAGKAVAQGEMVVVACTHSGRGRFERAALPEAFARQIEEADCEPIRFGERAERRG